MAKEIKQVVKVQLPAGSANPSMVGTTLGPTGVNMAEFCQKFNEQTRERNGEVTPAQITIYVDRTYDFILKQAPASYLIKKAAGIDKGSATSHNVKVGNLTAQQVREIAERKMPDLNANDVNAAMKIIAGTARSMGITVESLEETN
ncbi:MAG: 50S ribosomal protein L11 [Mycoplasmatales bacterium]